MLLVFTEENLHCLMFGRAAVLPVDFILGVPPTTEQQSQLDHSRHTVENLQVAYELARHNLKQ